MSDLVIGKSEILSRVPNKYELSSRAGVFLSMPTENKIVNVVDEESSTARLFHYTLCTIKGIDVFQFTDSINALEHLKLHKGDYLVMISDLRMPVVNAVQLLKTVKDLNPFGTNNFSYSI